jgi:predicted signal transduction protein with EAL and GGDEF domain
VTDERKLPSLTAKQLEALRRFALLEIDEAELRQRLTGVFEIHFEPMVTAGEGRTLRRTATGNFRVPEPGIVISRQHIANALEQKRLGQITERELVHWATILLLNDAYVLDPGDEDLIAEWLNDISVNLDGS